jgi:hypothetical protein
MKDALLVAALSSPFTMTIAPDVPLSGTLLIAGVTDEARSVAVNYVPENDNVRQDVKEWLPPDDERAVPSSEDIRAITEPAAEVPAANVANEAESDQAYLLRSVVCIRSSRADSQARSAKPDTPDFQLPEFSRPIGRPRSASAASPTNSIRCTRMA